MEGDESGESMELMEEVPSKNWECRIGEISAWLSEGSRENGGKMMERVDSPAGHM